MEPISYCKSSKSCQHFLQYKRKSYYCINIIYTAIPRFGIITDFYDLLPPFCVKKTLLVAITLEPAELQELEMNSKHK